MASGGGPEGVGFTRRLVKNAVVEVELLVKKAGSGRWRQEMFAGVSKYGSMQLAGRMSTAGKMKER